MRFTLRDMFIATAIVAVACVAARYAAANPIDNLWAIVAVPVLIGAAVGTLRHHTRLWARRGLAFGAGLLILLILWTVIRIVALWMRG